MNKWIETIRGFIKENWFKIALLIILFTIVFEGILIIDRLDLLRKAVALIYLPSFNTGTLPEI